MLGRRVEETRVSHGCVCGGVTLRVREGEAGEKSGRDACESRVCVGV